MVRGMKAVISRPLVPGVLSRRGQKRPCREFCLLEDNFGGATFAVTFSNDATKT